MKLKYFIIALVAMLSCFTSKALAQEVILVHNAQELKQALMMSSSAESSAARRMAAATSRGEKPTLLEPAVCGRAPSPNSCILTSCRRLQALQFPCKCRALHPAAPEL